MSPGTWHLELRAHGLPGVLVAFDGVDGSGKTTMIRLSARYLRSLDWRVRVFKLPSRELKASSWFIRYSRDPLGTASRGDVDPIGMCAAVLGDRLITIRRSIMPLLLSGSAVLVDRYLLTPLGELVMLGVDAVGRDAIAPLVARFPQPDVLVVTEVAHEEAMLRVRRRPGEADDALPAEVYRRRVDAFRELAVANHGVVLDTSGGISLTFEAIRPQLAQAVDKTGLHGAARKAGAQTIRAGRTDGVPA